VIKIKFRNTRDNKPTFKLEDLQEFLLGDKDLFAGETVTLRLVNKAGITADTTFTVDDAEELAVAVGWNIHVNPLERNNRPFEVGVCFAQEGDEITQKFGGKTPPAEQDFEEFDDEEEEDEFDDSDEDADDDFEDDEEEAVAPPVAKPEPRAVTAARASEKAPSRQPNAKPVKASKKPYADALKKHGTQAAAARALGLGVDAFRYRLGKENGSK